MDSAQRKKLANISNLQWRFNPTNQDFKQKSTTLTTKEYVEKFHKVYMFVVYLYVSVICVYGCELMFYNCVWSNEMEKRETTMAGPRGLKEIFKMGWSWTLFLLFLLRKFHFIS